MVFDGGFGPCWWPTVERFFCIVVALRFGERVSCSFAGRVSVVAFFPKFSI